MSNSGFSGISNRAGVTAKLSVGTLNVESYVANSVPTVNDSNYTRETVVGYAADGFSTLGIASFVALVDTSLAPLAGDLSNATFIPDGSIVETIQMDNNGTPITSGGLLTLTLRTADAAFNPLSGVDYVDGALPATVNSGRAIANLTAAGAVGAMTPVAFSALPALPPPGDNYLRVGANVAAVTAGELKVTITYLAPV